MNSESDDKQKIKVKSFQKKAAGFSLLETIMSISLSMILLTNLFMFYYGSAKTSAKEQIKMSADRESHLVTMSLERQLRLVGLTAEQDMNGDSNDIRRDVPGLSWSDSLCDDFEFANTYQLVFTSDYDNDGKTETLHLFLSGNRINERVWEWSRDSIRWTAPTVRFIGNNVDYLMFKYFDNSGSTIPAVVTYPAGGYTLTAGERVRITAVEVTVVLKTDDTIEGNHEYLYMPDGTYWHDGYRRIVHRFMIRGRNLSLGI